LLSTAGEAISWSKYDFYTIFILRSFGFAAKKQLINANSQLQDKIDHCYCVCLFELISTFIPNLMIPLTFSVERNI